MWENILAKTCWDTLWQQRTLIGRKMLPGYSPSVWESVTVEPTLHPCVLQPVVDIMEWPLTLTTIGPLVHLGRCVILRDVKKVLTLTRSIAYLILLRF